MKELEVITIDENDYFVIKEIKLDSVSYLYLSNVNDEEDRLIRKINLDDPNTLLPLQNEEEFEKACNLLLKHVMI